MYCTSLFAYSFVRFCTHAIAVYALGIIRAREDEFYREFWNVGNSKEMGNFNIPLIQHYDFLSDALHSRSFLLKTFHIFRRAHDDMFRN